MSEWGMRECLSEIRADLRALHGRIGDLREDVAGLKVKAGIWGGLAGLVPAVLALAYVVLK